MIDDSFADSRRHPCGLVAKRTEAFVRTDAVTGPGRAEVDAYTRQLGYPISAQPLIPIQGPFVAHHQGVFDIQSQATAFLNVSTAQGYADYLWAAAQGTNWTTVALSANSEARASGAILGRSPYQDWEAVAILRLSTVVIYVTADGSREEVDAMLDSLLLTARSNLTGGLQYGAPPTPYAYG